VSGVTWCGPNCSSGRLFQVINGAADVTIDHNTAFHDGPVILSDGLPSPRFSYTNNLSHRAWGVLGSGTGEGIPALTQYFPSYVFNKNLIYGVTQMDGSASQPCQRPDKIGCHPPNNFYPPDGTYGGTFEGLFANHAGGDYRLPSGSPYENVGTDGKDVGADIDAVSAATAGAVSGVWGSSQSPFGGSAASLPGSVEAENFDQGGEGVAYHDLTPGNLSGSTYRTSDVDMYDTSVMRLQAGEWLEYTVNVGASGSSYAIVAQVGSDTGGGTFHVEFDGVDVTGPMTFPNTGGWTTFQAVTKTGVTLSAGQKVMRLVIDDTNNRGSIELGSVKSITLAQ
jgi:hypothetical protein